MTIDRGSSPMTPWIIRKRIEVGHFRSCRLWSTLGIFIVRIVEIANTLPTLTALDCPSTARVRIRIYRRCLGWIYSLWRWTIIIGCRGSGGHPASRSVVRRTCTRPVHWQRWSWLTSHLHGSFIWHSHASPRSSEVIFPDWRGRSWCISALIMLRFPVSILSRWRWSVTGVGWSRGASSRVWISLLWRSLRRIVSRPSTSLTSRRSSSVLVRRRSPLTLQRGSSIVVRGGTPSICIPLASLTTSASRPTLWVGSSNFHCCHLL